MWGVLLWFVRGELLGWVWVWVILRGYYLVILFRGVLSCLFICLLIVVLFELCLCFTLVCFGFCGFV